MKEEKFPNSRKPSHRHVCEEFLESQRATQPGEEKKKKNPQNMCLTATTSGDGEVA